MLIAGTMEIEQIKKIRKEFFDAYFKNRKLQEYENINIKKIACFLNGIYYAKYLNQLYKNGYEAEAICFSNYLVENYNKIDFGLDMRV